LGHLNKVGWKNVEAKFEELSGRKLEHLQFKKKWDSLKNVIHFYEVKKMPLLVLDAMKKIKLWMLQMSGWRNI
jgi:hypothetical protein